MKKKGIIALALTAALALGALTGCGSSAAKATTGSTDAAAETTKASETAGSEAAGSATEAASGEGRVVKLGLTGVIYEDIWNPIKEELAKEGVDLEYVQFSDYSLPNEALNAGEIDIMLSSITHISTMTWKRTVMILHQLQIHLLLP